MNFLGESYATLAKKDGCRSVIGMGRDLLDSEHDAGSFQGVLPDSFHGKSLDELKGWYKEQYGVGWEIVFGNAEKVWRRLLRSLDFCPSAPLMNFEEVIRIFDLIGTVMAC